MLGDTEEVNFWGGVGLPIETTVLLDQVSFRATVMQIPRRTEESKPVVAEGQGTAVTPEGCSVTPAFAEQC